MIKLPKPPAAKKWLWFAYVVVIGVVGHALYERMPYVAYIVLGIFILIRLYRAQIADSRMGKFIFGPTDPEMMWAMTGVFVIVGHFYSPDIVNVGMGALFLLIALRIRNQRSRIQHLAADPW